MYRKHIKHNVSWSDMSFMDQKSRQTAGSCLAGNNKQKAKHAGYGKNSAKSLFQFMNIIMYIYIYILIIIIVVIIIIVIIIVIIIILIIITIIITYYYYLLLLLSYIYTHTCVTVCL